MLKFINNKRLCVLENKNHIQIKGTFKVILQTRALAKSTNYTILSNVAYSDEKPLLDVF